MWNRAAHPTPLSIISFGTAPIHYTVRNRLAAVGAPVTGYGADGGACNAPNLPAYTLSIPTAQVFHDVPGGVPGGVGATIDVDLYLVQQKMLSELV